MTNVLIIGYGSIGKKHERSVKSLGLNVSIFSRRKKLKKNYNSLEEALNIVRPSYAIIANETSEHLKTLKLLINFNVKKILVEKPLFSKPTNIIIKNSKVFVGYNLRFHPLLIELASQIRRKKIISADLYAGSFISNWRTRKDYKNSYSFFASKGGGVLRDLSHEIEILISLFGNVKELVASGGHLSNIFGDSEDVYKIIFKTSKCRLVSLSLDYLNKMNKREIVINTKNETYLLDFTNKSLLRNKKSLLSLNDFNMSETYKKMHLDILYENGKNCCSFNKGNSVVKLISDIEKSNKKNKWVIT